MPTRRRAGAGLTARAAPRQEFTLCISARNAMGLGADARAVVRSAMALVQDMWAGTFGAPIPLPGSAYSKAMAARRRLLPIVQGVIDDRRRLGAAALEGRMDAVSQLIRSQESRQVSDAEVFDQVKDTLSL